LAQTFFDPKGKIEKFGIFGGNFPNPEVADPTQTYHYNISPLPHPQADTCEE